MGEYINTRLLTTFVFVLKKGECGMALGSPKVKLDELPITKELRQSVSRVDTLLDRSGNQRMKKIKKRSIVMTNTLFYLFILLAACAAGLSYLYSHNNAQQPHIPATIVEQQRKS